MSLGGETILAKGGSYVKFYADQDKFYGGTDLHARSMYVCILDQKGKTVIHRNDKASPEAFLRAIKPYRKDIAVAVECMFVWYWLADVCAQEKNTFVLGQALNMKAIHGGKSKNDKIDSKKSPPCSWGGTLPVVCANLTTLRATPGSASPPKSSHTKTP